ncbi:hypothetical protein X798_01011 [Onchocerca flexuosa]|uniref:Uncharacterized protein n=1 Tax=Onchocerca flexuosa TaxID=387005 RepID=A0A238C446_9BILA|nr:hypothetical protein X798_01011 [Onchocerca flexuosa]
MSKEFDLDVLDNEQKVLVEGLPTSSAMKIGMKYDLAADSAEMRKRNDDEMRMEVEDVSGETIIYHEKKKNTEDDIVTRGNSFPDSFTIDGNSQINRAIKLAVKKHKKKNKKFVVVFVEYFIK